MHWIVLYLTQQPNLVFEVRWVRMYFGCLCVVRCTWCLLLRLVSKHSATQSCVGGVCRVPTHSVLMFPLCGLPDAWTNGVMER